MPPSEPLRVVISYARKDGAEYVLALMTSGSYVSEICRAEQLGSKMGLRMRLRMILSTSTR